MKKLRFLFVITSLFCTMPSTAQNENESPHLSAPFIDEDISHFNFVLSDNTIVHIDIDDVVGKKIVVTKTGPDNLMTTSKELERSARDYMCLVRKLGDKIYIFSKDKLKFFYSVLDPVEMTISDEVPLGIRLQFLTPCFKGDFYGQNYLGCSMSPDGSKMLVYCRDSQYDLSDNIRNRSFGFAVFDSGGAGPYTRYHTFSSSSKVHSLDIGVDNSGIPVFLLKTEVKKKGNNLKCSYSMQKIDGKSTPPDELTPPPNDIVAMRFAGIRNESWIVTGYASGDNSDIADKMIMGELDGTSAQWVTEKIPGEYVSAYRTKNKQLGTLKDGSLGFRNIRPEAAFVGADGSVAMVSLLTEEKLDNMGIKSDDILIFAFTGGNEFAWADRIPYRQYYAIDCIVSGSHLFLLHFNQPENLTLSGEQGPEETPRRDQCKTIVSIFDMGMKERKDLLLNIPMDVVAKNLRFSTQLVAMARIRRSALRNDTVIITFDLPEDALR